MVAIITYRLYSYTHTLLAPRGGRWSGRRDSNPRGPATAGYPASRRLPAPPQCTTGLASLVTQLDGVEGIGNPSRQFDLRRSSTTRGTLSTSPGRQVTTLSIANASAYPLSSGCSTASSLPGFATAAIRLPLHHRLPTRLARSFRTRIPAVGTRSWRGLAAEPNPKRCRPPARRQQCRG